MPRNRIHSQLEGVFVGPAPASGFHFIDVFGNLNNEYGSGNNYNLVVPINRVNSCGYDITLNRATLQGFGKRGYVSRPILDPPEVNLNFSYWQMGVINEYRLGFYVNYQQLEASVETQPIFPDNFQVCVISGFINREFEPATNSLNWPYTYRDKRNIFVMVAPDGQDLNNPTTGQSKSSGTVLAFGNCYINSYQASAAVNGFPQAAVSYTCENVCVYSSGSGIPIPAIDPKTRSGILNKKAEIPQTYQGNTPSVLLPGDITVDVSGLAAQSNILAVQGTGLYVHGSPNVVRLGLPSFNDVAIQSYDINMPLARESLRDIQYKLPVDRQINFPVPVNLNISALVKDFGTGSLEAFLNHDDDYNITIKLRNPHNAPTGGIGVQYDFLRAKLISVDSSLNIGSNRAINASFVTEIDPADYSRGFFMSGQLNVSRPTDLSSYLIMEEDSSRILQEDNSLIVLHEIAFFV